MTRPAYDRDMRELAALVESNLPHGFGIVLYGEQHGDEFDYWWNFKKLEIAG